MKAREYATGVIMASLIAAIAVLSACEDTVNPFVDSDDYFTVFGYLDTASDTQYVRVIPLRKNLGGKGQFEIDAIVTTTPVENGRPITWRDSVITTTDGYIMHVFYAAFRPIPAWTYRLRVERSDGKSTLAETTVPAASGVSVSEPYMTIEGLNQRVLWDNVDFPPFRVEVWYRFLPTSPNAAFVEGVVPYEDIGEPRNENTWEIVAKLTRDSNERLPELGPVEGNVLMLVAIGMRLAVTDEKWRPPDGIFDPDVVVQPGVFSNVLNGFGFFGSINQYTVEWTLDEETIKQLGYRFPG